MDWSGEALLVFWLDTPHTTHREVARRLVRRALRETLAGWLACPPAEIELASSPGQALQLILPERAIGLSLSHEPGISLVAINPAGAVGVDVLRPELPDMSDAELARLADDYLDPETARAIARLASADRRSAFARAWTCLEAGLKCRGDALTEWSPARSRTLDDYACRLLCLPRGTVGSVVVPVRQPFAGR